MYSPGKSFVVKRDGRKEQVHLDKITSRIQKLCYNLNMDYVDPLAITLKVVKTIFRGISTSELDSNAADVAIVMSSDHPDYAILAARIAISNLQKETKKHFSEVIDQLYHSTKRISEKHYKIIMENASKLNACIIYDRDFSYNYFSFKLLEHLYLLKINGKTVERPQHLLMRIAVGIHEDDIDAVIKTYNLLSEKHFIHDSTTIIDACAPEAQLSSSYSIMMPSDSIGGIFECISQCAFISRVQADVGVNMHNIRANGSYIAGTNGQSNGLTPMLRVFNNVKLLARGVESVKEASVTIYLEPWHADILDVLLLKKSSGKDELRARELNYALWIPDLFMKRVENNEDWTLMCPNLCRGLADVYGEDFEVLYAQHEASGLWKTRVPAQSIWKAIVASQVDNGGPSILYKDNANRRSNMKNLGTIRGSNATTELMLYASPTEAPSCNVASIAVNTFVKPDNSYDFVKLKEVTKVVAGNLDRIIDINKYPIEEAKTSSFRHRPIAIGIQGLADTFMDMRLAFDGPEAAVLNKQIFETLYYGALEASCELAQKNGPYSSYKDCPISEGKLQFDLWNVEPSDLWNWAELKENIAKHGVRNALLVACVPTQDTSNILGNSKSIEPFNTFIRRRKVGNEEFDEINDHLRRELTERNLWDNNMRDEIIANKGSLQNINKIPDDLKKIYKTVWEMSQKVILNLAADRAPFIDHSQSINIHLDNLNYGILSSMHFYGWKNGLKSGMFHLKQRASAASVTRNLEDLKIALKLKKEMENGYVNENAKDEAEEEEDENLAALVCSLANPGACDMCGA